LTSLSFLCNLHPAAKTAATLTPAPGPHDDVITITGMGDHFRPEWPNTITGVRSQDGFRDKSSKQKLQLHRGPLENAEFLASWID
jgi:hypothetical protein